MAKTTLILDTECYKNYWLAMFLAPNGKTMAFETYPGKPLDRQGLRKVLTDPRVEIVTFNGNNYDMPMINLALSGATCQGMHLASTAIIESDLKSWTFYKTYAIEPIEVDHVDLIEVSPGMSGLKIYGGRLHLPKMQDLPIEPDAEISETDRDALKLYCRNDLVVTRGLYDALHEEIELRRTMSEEYGVDLRSKSDAQIAEAVLKAEVTRISGIAPQRQPLEYNSFFYEPPSYIKFGSDVLKQAFDTICSAEMVIKDTGHVEMPKAIDDLDIQIGGVKYKIGIGGLHSQESEVTHLADENTLLIDRDVVSYYPNLMLNMGMDPPALGGHFQTVYRKILEERVAAKRRAGEIAKELDVINKRITELEND